MFIPFPDLKIQASKLRAYSYLAAMPAALRKKVLILCAHRPGRSPSQRYRFEQYLPWLQQHGFAFDWSFLLNEKDDRVFYAPGHLPHKALILMKSLMIRLRDLFRYKNYDIIFIQREAYFLGTSFFEIRAFRSGAKVIFDFDDSIWLADTSPANLKWEWLKKPDKFYRNCAAAHLVLAGNRYLQAEARKHNPQAYLIPTTVDTGRHVPQHERRHQEVLCIGWSGSLSTLKHFELLMPVLKELKARYGDRIRYKLIGDKRYQNSELEVEAVDWSAEAEVQELNSIDIGLMPLPEDKWARGKCGLKALTYMACEIPVVLSPVGVNSEIVRDGENGFLAANDREWINKLSLLIDQEDLRKSMGQKARQRVIEAYSVQRYQEEYLKIFEGLAGR